MKYHWEDQGEANVYTEVKQNNWFAQIRLNGELTVLQQKLIMNELVFALNGPQSGEPLYNLPLYP